MSDTDSIRTDRSQSDLQQKYDKLAVEFAKVRMQLNVLKKAYTANISKTEQFENCKYDLILSTDNLDDQGNFKNPNQVQVEKSLNSSDVHLLKQEINTMNLHIHRVLELTKSNQFDYNLIMSEIEYCNDVQNSCPNKFCETFNSEFESLKFSVSACLFKILHEKLESRSKITTDDSRLIYLNHYCLENCCKTEENKFKTIFTCIVVKLFLSVILNVHDVLEYLLKYINPDALQILECSLTSLNKQLHSKSLILDNILIYSEDLKTLKFDTQYIVFENVLLFISNKYVEFVDCIKHFTKSNDITENIANFSLRQIIISFMCLNFPIGELMITGEYWNSGDINMKLNDIYETIHIILRSINILEFEYLYKNSQLGLHWHMKNPLAHVTHSRQAIEELNSQNNYENLIHIYNEKLNKELERSLSIEQEKLHWQNEYDLLYKKHKDNEANTDRYSESTVKFVIENQLGKCESNVHFVDEVRSREQELKKYFEKKINKLIFTNKEMSSENNAYLMEISALKIQLEHSISIRNELKVKLLDAMEYIDELKEEFQLTSTNYHTQLRAMTEHLASLNETVLFERRHIENLNSQLITKDDKKKKK